jgi:ubiquitin-activating enzyme E1 C
MLTLGVVKNIIPAVASTNAIVSAACVNEALKVSSFCSQSLNTYMMYVGLEGINSYTFVMEAKDTCPVCGYAQADAFAIHFAQHCRDARNSKE